MMWKEIWREVRKRTGVRILLFIEVILLLAGIAGLFVKPEGAVLLDTSCDLTSGYSQTLSLKPGLYQVNISYLAEADTNRLSISNVGYSEGTVLFSDVTLASGDREESCQLWVLYPVDSASLVLTYAGEGQFLADSLEIHGTNGYAVIWIFLTVICSLLLNGLCVFRELDRRKPFSREQKTVWGVLAAAFVFSCVPVMVNYTLMGEELIGHLRQVESSGGGLFLTVPRMFRRIGFTVDFSCRLFYVFLNGASLLTAYICFAKIFRDRTAGCVSSVLYVLSAYRMHSLYLLAAWEECLAMIFLPLTALGIYRLFQKDARRIGCRKGLLAVSAGLAGIVLSYAPLLKSLTGEGGKVSAWYAGDAAGYKLSLTHLLFLFYGQGTESDAAVSGMYDAGAFSVGTALLLVLFVWSFLEFTGKMKSASEFSGKVTGRISLGLTCLFLLLSLWLPGGFTALACVSASVLAGCLMLYFRKNLQKESFVGFAVLFLACSFFFQIYQVNMQLVTGGFGRFYNSQSLENIDIGDVE